MSVFDEERDLERKLRDRCPNHPSLGIFYSNTWDAAKAYRKALKGIRTSGKKEVQS